LNDCFKQQIEGGATDDWFYGIESGSEVRIERHRGTLETLSLDGLVFDRMMGSTPFFRFEMPVEDKKQLIKDLLGANNES
jgi:hypothetical protein